MDADEVPKRVKLVRPREGLEVTVGGMQKGCYITAFNQTASAVGQLAVVLRRG